MEGELRLTLFGGLQATLAGQPLDLPCSKSLALLGYLATTGQSHSREALSTLLWGESSDARARASLRTALWHLREAVASFLVVDRQSVAFNPDSPHWVDAVEFERGLAKVRGGARGGTAGRAPSLTEDQADALQEAVELYRGEFLVCSDVRGAPGFEEWVLRKREWARESAIWALHRLVQYFTAQGEYGIGLDTVARLLMIAPWQEEAHRERMMLLALSGYRNAALAQYDTCRQVLAEALQTEPTLETELLYRDIKAGKARRRWEDRTGALRLHLPSWCPSPGLDERPLVGRDTEVGRLKRLLISSDARLTSLVGPEGSGKTTLARAVLGAIAKRFDQGVWFLFPMPGDGDLGRCARTPEDAELDVTLDPQWSLISSVGRALGVTFSATIPLATQLYDYLRHKELLLVLDEFDASSEQIDVVLSMLRQAPRIRILILGTEPLGVEDEHVFCLDGLSVPAPSMIRSWGPEELERVAAFDGVRLFIERAQEVAPAFELTAGDARHVVEVCQLTAGLPLAIELAAAWAGNLPLAAMTADVGRRLRKMKSHGRPDQPPLAIQAIFSYVWDLLGPDEQVDLARLATLYGEFGSDVALEVFGISKRRLQSLCNRALLTCTASERFQMHTLLRRLLIRRLGTTVSNGLNLREPVDLPHLEERLSAHYLGAVERQGDRLRGQEARRASAEIKRGWWNIRRAWCRAISDRDTDRLAGSLDSLSRFLLLQGWHWEGSRLLGAAARALLNQPEASREGDVALSCRLLAENARLLNAQVRNVQAAEVAQDVVELLNDSGGRALAPRPRQHIEASAHLEWGNALYVRGDLASGIDHIERALALVADGGPVEIQASGLLHLGQIEIERERFDEARKHLIEASDLYERLEDWYGRSRALSALALAEIGRWAYAQAESLAAEALKIAGIIGDRSGEALARTHLGRIAYASEDHNVALVHCRHGLRLAREIGDLRRECEALIESAWVSLDRDQLETAWRRSLLSQELARTIGLVADEGRALLVAGHAFAKLDMHHQAREAYRRALRIQRKLGQLDAASESLAGLAHLDLLEGHQDRAKSLVETVLEHVRASNLGGARDLVSVCLTCFEVLSAVGDERAQEVLQLASRRFAKQTAHGA